MKLTSSINILAWITLCAITQLSGCSSSDANSPNQQLTDRIEFYGKSLNSHSSPTNVAEVALLAIQKNDLETLANLIAADRVKKDLTSITQGKSQFSKWTASGPETSAKAIAISIQNMVQPVALGAETIPRYCRTR
jgi:hypothetical protein